MNPETKVIGLIGLVTIIIIVGGLYLAGKQGSTADGTVSIDPSVLVRADSPRRTGANAKVQIVEFGDLECPACAVLSPELKKLLETDGDNIDLVMRFIPIHSHSKQAAAAALAANEQGKYFEMADIMFAKQDEWAKNGVNHDALFEKYAAEAGLDIAKYKSDLDKNRNAYYALVDRDGTDASTAGINSTPTLVFNGKTVLKGAFPYEKLKEMVDAEIAASVASATSTPSTTAATSSSAQ